MLAGACMAQHVLSPALSLPRPRHVCKAMDERACVHVGNDAGQPAPLHKVTSPAVSCTRAIFECVPKMPGQRTKAADAGDAQRQQQHFSAALIAAAIPAAAGAPQRQRHACCPAQSPTPLLAIPLRTRFHTSAAQQKARLMSKRSKTRRSRNGGLRALCLPYMSTMCRSALHVLCAQPTPTRRCVPQPAAGLRTPLLVPTPAPPPRASRGT